MKTETTDRIEKTIHLKAPRDKVWSALTDSARFGAWFGARFSGPFAANTPVNARMTHPRYEHVSMTIEVDRIEPQTFFSYRWHPYAIDPNVDYSGEPTTLIEFTLSDDAGGTRLTVVESGFDRIPIGRRAQALEMNTGGWTAQLGNIDRYVANN